MSAAGRCVSTSYPRAVDSGSRVLYVCGSSLVPATIGPSRRNYHILQQLSRYYDVTLLAPGFPDDADHIRAACGGRLADIVLVAPNRDARGKFVQKVWRTATGRCDYLPSLERTFRAACVDVARRGEFDAIVLSTVLLGGLPIPPGVPVVVDSHNVEFDVHRRTAMASGALSRRIYAACQYWPTRSEEQRHSSRARLLLATSSRDRALFERTFDLRNVGVVANGIDLTEFRSSAPSRAPVILFSALMSYYPNQHGARWFLDNVFPIIRQRVPEARVVLAGADPPRWLRAREGAHVHVTGKVADMRPYIQNAGAVVVPLLIGGGTRVKILEAQAMERPVVSTTVGAEGLAQRHAETILLADDAEAFAAHVVRLLRDPTVAAQIARNGREHVVQHFDWNHIGSELNRLLTAHVGLRPAHLVLSR